MSFSERVWSTLRLIPRGRVITYGALARAVGWPRGARAVARACAMNPHPITTPCHRVVRSDGTIGGYSGPGGVAMKVALLRREGVRVDAGRVQGFQERSVVMDRTARELADAAGRGRMLYGSS